MVLLFYTNDGLIALPRLSRIQDSLDILTGSFDRVGLQTNVLKTVGMVCQPCYIFSGHLKVAYRRWIMGVGKYYRVWCLE